MKFCNCLLSQLSVNLGVSLFYLQNWQNYAAFIHRNLAVETLSKIVSTIQVGENAVIANPVWVEINA